MATSCLRPNDLNRCKSKHYVYLRNEQTEAAVGAPCECNWCRHFGKIASGKDRKTRWLRLRWSEAPSAVSSVIRFVSQNMLIGAVNRMISHEALRSTCLPGATGLLQLLQLSNHLRNSFHILIRNVLAFANICRKIIQLWTGSVANFDIHVL